jgi:glucokinase
MPRLAFKAYFLDDPKHLEQFIQGDLRTIQIPFTNKTISYDALSRIGIGISKLGVNKATSLGAYVFAISQLDW